MYLKIVLRFIINWLFSDGMTYLMPKQCVFQTNFRIFERFYYRIMKNIVLPDIKERSLAFYLAMEEFVAERIEDEAFFVWRVAPTVIIGRNQDLDAEVNM